MKTAEVLGVVVGSVGLLLTAGGLYITARKHAWERRRDAERRSSHIVIGASERAGLGDGDLIIGERRPREHVLVVSAENHAETPAYVSSVRLEPEELSPFRVYLHQDGTREVQPGNREQFLLELDGSQGFPWHERFRIVVELANGAQFASPFTQLDYPPHHGEPFVVPDPAAVADDEVHVIRPDDLEPGRRD